MDYFLWLRLEISIKYLSLFCPSSIFIFKKSCCEQSCQTPAPHTDLSLHDTEYLPPSHPHLQPFHFSSFFFLHLFLCTWRWQEELCFLLPWQGRLGQAFTSSLPPAIISLICAPTPLPLYPCSSLLPHPSLPLSFCLWHTAIGLEWSEERRGRNSRTTLNFWPFNSVNLHCRLLARTLRPSVFAIITQVSLPLLRQEHKG